MKGVIKLVNKEDKVVFEERYVGKQLRRRLFYEWNRIFEGTEGMAIHLVPQARPSEVRKKDGTNFGSKKTDKFF